MSIQTLFLSQLICIVKTLQKLFDKKEYEICTRKYILVCIEYNLVIIIIIKIDIQEVKKTINGPLPFEYINVFI